MDSIQRERLFHFCFSVASVLALALPAHAAEPPRPKLVVALVVDQYSTDLFNEYRALYTSGLAQLSDGVVFPRGHQGHAATETCPGHSTILTGARPARTGIIANDWQDPRLSRKDKSDETFTIYCVEKTGEPGSDARKKVMSPDTLLVPTLGDRMKAKDANTRVVSVAGKDRSAIMLGGHHADLTLWWTDAGFVTYGGRDADIPKEVTGKINASMRKSYASPTKATVPPECSSKARATKVTDDISIGVPQSFPGNSRRWRATPAMDSFTVDAALAAAKDRQLGKRDSIDLLAISLSANDYVGHYYGNAGAEMCVQQLALDQTIGRLLTSLDKLGVPYVVALSADHGGVDTTERNRERGVAEAQRLDPNLLPKNVSAQLARELQLKEPVVLGMTDFNNDIYLSVDIPSEKRAAVLDTAYIKYRSHPQVAAVFTRNELIAAAPPAGPVDEWTLLERAKASFNPQRSGDLIVLLKPYISIYAAPKNVDTDYTSSHGSTWGYDRRVPILFWWPGVEGFQQPTAVETADIAPTLAALIGLEIPAIEIDGRALPLVLH
ncbi:MAG: alkaline phosphatase family protein [Steroidobacter sp.]